MSMFKSAATKIAHNSTIPALGGNSDLRPLQDLILAEKQVLTSLQKLSADFAKAAEALRIWGSGEGDDLGDILGASTTVLTLWSSAISQYAAHGHPMREYLKSIRTREERLDELKRRRKAVSAKAETAERKLSKMSPEHKNLVIQTDSLNALRAEIRTMDSDIMTEEAALGDFKRSTTRAWMGLKFGGLLECAEKGTIAGEFGKLIIAEISEDQTQPGTARSLYYGRASTEQLVSEAHRCINEVVMSTVPSNPTNTQSTFQQNHPQHTPQGSFQGTPQNPFDTPQAPFQDQGIPGIGGPRSNDWSSPSASEGQPNYLPAPLGLGTGQFLDQTGTPTAGPGSPTQQHYPSQSDQPTAPYNRQSEYAEQAPPRSVDDFGVNTQNPWSHDQPGPGSGRFATFPVKTRPSGLKGYSLTDPPSLAARQNSDSFSSSVAQALSSSQSPPANVPQPSFSGFNNTYEASQAPSFAPPQGLPPGAAAPSGPAGGWNTSLHHEERDAASDDEGGLAYMADPEEPLEVAASRHVRFGEVNNVDEELDRRDRRSNDTYQQQQYEGQPPEYQDIPLSIETEQPSLNPPPQASVGSGNYSPTMDARFQNQRRVPAPSVDTVEEERALNAAAAREVSREMDALTFNPPIDTQSPDRGRASSLSQPGLGHGTAPATPMDLLPLAPPSAPFAKRTPSPHPGNDSPTLPYSPHNAPPTIFNQGSPPTIYSQGPAQSQQAPLPPARDSPNGPASAVTPRPNNSAAPRNSQDDSPRIPPISTSSSPYQSPYQTPPEYPRGLGMSNSPITKSTTSLNTQMPPGARTISAAAFKRPPRMASGDLPPSLADPRSTSPMSLRKRLPSSPHPQREGSPSRRGRSGSPAQKPAQPAPSQALPPLPTEEDDYDYLSAYVNTGSPADVPAPTPAYVANEAQNGAKAQGGYGEGRFATNLEGGLR